MNGSTIIIATYLYCATHIHTGCIYGSIQLVGGRNQYEGTVQLCKNDEWGTVCDYRWDYREAQVVCRQLGYDYDGGLTPELT